jgi:hypothetical protein
MHFQILQQFKELNKALYKSISKLICNIFNCRSTPKKHNKICFTNFGALQKKIHILQAFIQFLKSFSKIIFFKTRSENATCTPLSPLDSTRTRCHVGPTGQRAPPIGHAEVGAVLIAGISPTRPRGEHLRVPRDEANKKP